MQIAIRAGAVGPRERLLRCCAPHEASVGGGPPSCAPPAPLPAVCAPRCSPALAPPAQEAPAAVTRPLSREALSAMHDPLLGRRIEVGGRQPLGAAQGPSRAGQAAAQPAPADAPHSPPPAGAVEGGGR